MRAKEANDAMRWLGGAFILAWLVNLDADPLLLAPAAAVAIWAMVRLRPLATTGTGRLALSVAIGCAAAAGAVDVVGWFVDLPTGTVMGTGITIEFAGIAAYAAFAASWTDELGWTEPHQAFARARSVIAGTWVGVAALAVVHLVATEPADAPARNVLPSSIFGRPLEGAGGTFGLVAYLVLALVMLWALGTATRATRDRLEADPDQALVLGG